MLNYAYIVCLSGGIDKVVDEPVLQQDPQCAVVLPTGVPRRALALGFHFARHALHGGPPQDRGGRSEWSQLYDPIFPRATQTWRWARSGSPSAAIHP
eukprot:CAMPEP_0176070846 /NCGR_PEP_ID=MMETSP0120_2-20121206/35383_1 /TAXON_ID=160619 /ORGANISM="Kryptoperidinium foliaceum, Strain CCMP 1326" /LENGTH=96 /DNA_ID=CAMNT_0017404499 /DNA_START=254 /DNA_END=540 /DNA_ORIENTATION=+